MAGIIQELSLHYVLACTLFVPYHFLLSGLLRLTRGLDNRQPPINGCVWWHKLNQGTINLQVFGIFQKGEGYQDHGLETKNHHVLVLEDCHFKFGMESNLCLCATTSIAPWLLSFEWFNSTEFLSAVVFYVSSSQSTTATRKCTIVRSQVTSSLAKYRRTTETSSGQESQRTHGDGTKSNQTSQEWCVRSVAPPSLAVFPFLSVWFLSLWILFCLFYFWFSLLVFDLVNILQYYSKCKNEGSKACCRKSQCHDTGPMSPSSRCGGWIS